MSEPLEIKCDGAQGIDEAYNLRQNGKERGFDFDSGFDCFLFFVGSLRC
jgi:hypothetical protein